MTYEELSKVAAKVGFTAWAALDPNTIELKPEVREMCAANTCGQYGRCWSCPPGCGSLEECARQVGECTHGILVQTCGSVVDSFDYESMMEIEQAHKNHFYDMLSLLQNVDDNILAIGAGCCTQCEKCTYPDAPCRFPKKRVASMEAYGMLVLEVCMSNGMQYYYGPDKMAFTGCFLFKGQ